MLQIISQSFNFKKKNEIKIDIHHFSHHFDYYRLINIHSYLFQHAFRNFSLTYISIKRQQINIHTYIHIYLDIYIAFFYNKK